MLSARRSTERLDVLLVEPKDLVALRLRAQLESLGHRVLARARDGREALTAAQRLQPNLIVMESKLPGLDGIDAARAIVADQPVPVILLADYAGAELVRRAKEAGVVACLTSTDQQRLVDAIEVALERFGELLTVRRERSDPQQVARGLRKDSPNGFGIDRVASKGAHGFACGDRLADLHAARIRSLGGGPCGLPLANM